jgi:hypothetical protein
MAGTAAILALNLLLLVLPPSNGDGSSAVAVAGVPLASFAIVVCNATQNVAGSPHRQEEDAAEDVWRWLSLATHRNLTLHLSAASWCDPPRRPSASAPVIAVGAGAARWCGVAASNLSLLPVEPGQGLGQEGVLVTSTGLAPGCVVATGAEGAARGALYASTELLELLGFRFLHSEETVVPSNNSSSRSRSSLRMPPTFHRRYVPQLEYRAFDDFTATVTPRWVQHARINSLGDWGTRWNHAEASGGSVDYAQGPAASNLTYPGFSHTAFNLVPPYLRSTHPEWFGGDPHSTVPAGGQLCWANPELIQFLTRRVQSMLRGPSRGSTIVSISNNDAAPPPPGVSRWCNRSDDARAIAEEGSPMGPLLRAVNAVAAAIEPEFPDVAISTMACT